MQTSKTFKRIILIVLVAIFFALGVVVFKAALSGSVSTETYNYHMRQIDKNNEDIEMLFLGASRTYRSFDPDVFEEKLGIKNAVNAGTPSQRPQLSYYLLKDILKKHHPKYVVLGATYNGLQYEQEYHTASVAMGRLQGTSRVKAMANIFGPNDSLLLLTGKSEYAKNLHPRNIIENLKIKLSGGNDYTETKTQIIKGNGFNGAKDGLPLGGITYKYGSDGRYFAEEEILDKNIHYYKKIIELCKEENINVFMVSGVCSLMQLYRVENYQGANDYYEKLANSNNLRYFNLNLLKNRDTTFPDDNFKDYLHLNNIGGQKCSEIFAQILKEEMQGKDTTQYFYKDLKDLQKDIRRIPACAIESSHQDDEVHIWVDSVHNEDVTPQYRLLGVMKDGEEEHYTLLKSWTTSQKFTLPSEIADKYDKIRAEARTGKNFANEIYAFATCK